MSFRGEDTRRSFASHLYVALSKHLVIFMDDPELKKGDEISSALIKAIKESDASIVIFSKDYASSKWCLNELVKILECKKANGQIVIPIFYEIDPSHVRKQTGSYGQAFAKYEQDSKHNKEELQKWRNALTEAANLAGWHSSQNYGVDPVFIRDIVEDVLKKFHRRHPFEVKEFVGIDDKHDKIEPSLKIGSNDVRILALWGMGGIGKSTLAESLYAKHCSKFERHCFLKNVREVSTRCGVNVVRKILFSTLLELRLDAPYVENPILIRKLAWERSLIVLDDVATTEQAENLNIVNDCLGPGSRVIVTTRDKQICSQFNECSIYEVEGLNMDDSLQLFCLYAFREKRPEVGYEELSKSAICYCRGNPLALKVLGANLSRKSKEAWESELEKIKEIPHAGIHDVLKLSFNDLDRTQQETFLDIACLSFFRKLHEFEYYSQQEYIIDLFNACEFYPATEIEVLVHKALMTFRHVVGRPSSTTIEMHDLLVEMGKEIVKKEYPKTPGRRSRLWDPKEIYQVFKYNKGTDAVEVIQFDTYKIGDLYLSSKSFESMINLRFIHIIDEYNNVHLPEGLEWLSDKLRHLYWDRFPLESLPSSFCAERLVQLSMTRSKLKKLWNGIQKLDSLTIVNLDQSEDLIEIPDLSRAPNLKILSLVHCVSLRQLHPSIFTAPKLRELRLKGCKKIKSLKTNIHLKSLQSLDLSDCSSLVEFSVTSEQMKELFMNGTAIREFPSSMWRNSKLIYLDLSECKKLDIVGKKLSNDPGLESLTYLKLSGCTQINTLNMWFILDGARSLEYLHLNNCCNLEALPANIQNCLMLKMLYLDECMKLKSIPKLPASLQKLSAMNCTYLDTNSIQREMLENMLYRLSINDYEYGLHPLCLLPGAEVPCEFDFHTTEPSLVFPPNPTYGLSCFVFCITFSEGLTFTFSDYVHCTMYYPGEKFRTEFISCGTLISDHVLLISWSRTDYIARVDNDLSSLSFKVKVIHYLDDVEQWSTKEIKGCGVISLSSLEHSLGLDGSSSRSKVEIVELPFNAQVSSDEFDVDENEDEFDVDENEDAQQQLLIIPTEKEEDLNDKSSCDCFIGHLLKHLLEESKRLFLSVCQAKG